MKPNVRENTVKLALMAMFTALSVVLLFFVHIPFPPAPFLEYDLADSVIILATLILGLPAGLTILFAASAIQAFLFGGNGWIGLVMHFAGSGALIACIGLFFRKKRKFKFLIIGVLVGAIARTAVMIPMNRIFTVNFFGVPLEQFYSLIVPAFIPFNLTQSLLNGLLAILLYKALSPISNKIIKK
ncbi:MAG: ECF transporter S component [Oscillospiraceae bacterium]|jgi:riboflavin transporter FmnP|nr:ECF transporter S component [Oscillospiraceae bacterium]